jgi:hypothetical protein
MRNGSAAAAETHVISDNSTSEAKIAVVDPVVH